MRDLTLVLGLALRGVAPSSHLINNDNATWRWVILSFVRALTCCAPLAVEALLGAWLYYRTQASHTVGLGRVQAGDGCQPTSVDNLVVSQKDATG